MKVLVTGANGQLGHDSMQELRKRGHEAIGVDVAEMDITDEQAVQRRIRDISPDAVLHCAAWTAVDAAEEEENIKRVYAVNEDGTKNLVSICKELNCKFMYISTDYVFDGQGTIPWKPDCKDYKPLNVYGQSKLNGELAVVGTLDKFFIVRIAWVFGKQGNNFIKTMLKLGETRNEINIVNDQVGTPTYSFDLARLLIDMLETTKYGYYHVTNEGGYISWYDFAVEIFHQAELLGHKKYSKDKLKVNPVSTKEYGLSKAVRPFNSRLDKSKLIENGFTPLPTWKDAVSRYLKEIM